MEWLEHLKIDRRDLTALADAYGAYANVLASAEKNRELLPLTASSRLLSAVYKALVEPRAARDEFRDAARLYWDLKHPYGSVLAVCAEDSETVLQYWNVAQERGGEERSGTDLLSPVIVSCWLSGHPQHRAEYRGILSRVLERSWGLSAITVGRLRLPLRLYLAAVEEISHSSRNPRTPNSGRFKHTIAWLERAAEPVAQAMQDRFHWHRVHSGILPIEPEIVATCVGIVRVLNQGNLRQNLARLLTETNASPLAVIPCEVANNLVDRDESGGSVLSREGELGE